MLLRRVIDHVRKQEWTAIWIDLVIVVVGVFIGIQVSNWNDERATVRRAAVFSERLRSDLREEAWGYEMQVGYYTAWPLTADAPSTPWPAARHCPMSNC